MTDKSHDVTGAHLVGSVPFIDSAEVFSQVSSRLGAHLKRMPDGETGTRSNWINWQYAILESCPQLEQEPSMTGGNAPVYIRLRNSFNFSDVKLGALGYSAAAIASYSEFSKQKQIGKIAPDCRFQVSLPTPLAPIQFYVSSEDRADLEPVYEAQLLTELHEIVAAIPNDELAIQWDTAVEFGILEGTFVSHLNEPFTDIITRLTRLGNAIPEDIELGYHLCYGDSKHKHFVEPADAGHLAAVSNSIAAGLNRVLNWIHLPVPRDRFDAEFYKPLESLMLSAQTELYLGLIHFADGKIGAQRRIESARKSVKKFGIATECGFGRRPVATVTDLLDLHANVANIN